MRNVLKSIIGRFLKIWQTTDRTGQQVARGSFLVLFSRFFIKGLQFIRTIILARLLFPEDFGLFSMATLTMTFSGVFFQHGFYSTLVYEKGRCDDYFNCAWTANLLKNTFVGLILFFVAPFVSASFFNNGQIIPLIRALAFVVFIEGWQNVGVVLLNKELRFNKKFFYDIIVVFLEICCVIVSAYFLRNVWALIIGVFASRVVDLFLSYIFLSYRPKFYFNLAIAKHLFKYGKWIGLAGIVAFLTSQGDSLMIGRLLSTYNLGIYSLAFALGTMPAVEISKVLCNILFPFFSKIHNNPQLLKISFTELFRLIFTMVIPALTGIYVLAAEIIKIVYGQKWQGMLPILPVIILIAVLNTFQAVVTPLFSGIGRPKISTLVLIIQSIIMFALITPFVRIFGVVGAAWAVFAGLFISQTVLFLQLRATINLGVRGFLKILSLPFLSSGVMYLLINFTKNILAISNFLLLIGYVVYGFLIYFGALYAFDRLFGRKYYQSWLWFKKNI